MMVIYYGNGQGLQPEKKMYMKRKRQYFYRETKFVYSILDYIHIFGGLG